MLERAVQWPHDSLRATWDAGHLYPTGVTEPWTQQVVAALLVASGQRNVLELGSYLGLTTVWLALALERLGGGTLTTVELDPARFEHTKQRLYDLRLQKAEVHFVNRDSLVALADLPDASVGFAWVDDDHQAAHVAEELRLLRPKMVPGGLITMHDVSGPLGLDTVCRAHGGYVLHFPRLGVAGGLGVIQC